MGFLAHWETEFFTAVIIAMDTVISVVPNADISKRHKITFFSIISKI